MNDVDVATWLTQEANDLLDEGPVGLYEFIWRLNGSQYNLSPDESQQLSRQVVHRMLADRKAHLFAVDWPSFAIVSGPLPESVLEGADAWSEGEAGTLIALMLPEDVEVYRAKRTQR